MDRLPHHRILGEIGRGSMGIVYRARDERSGDIVALKTLADASPASHRLLKDEFRVLADVSHPSLVQFHELFVESTGCFFTMELIDGLPPAEHLAAASSEAEHATRVERLVEHLVTGLHVLHSAGIRHGDVKPANVRVRPDGQAVLLDFGVSERLGARRSGDQTFSGTLAYLAPEAIFGAPSPASDFYSLGVTLFELLTRTLPIHDASPDFIQAKFHPFPTRPREIDPRVPGWLDALVMELGHPDPAQRPGGHALLRRLGVGSDSALVSPLPRHAQSTGSFIGREAELEILDRTFERLLMGRPGVVHVRGPSGIGKTALLDRFVGTVESQAPALILRSTCHPRETMGFAALDAAIDDLADAIASGIDAEPTDATNRSPAETAVFRIFPALADAAPPGSSAVSVDEGSPLQRFAAADELAGLLRRAAADRPVILILDDLQWADRDSAAFLGAVLHAEACPPMMVVLTYRSESEPVGFVDTLGRTSLAPHDWTHARIDLPPLRPEEARTLADRLLAHEGMTPTSPGDPLPDESGGLPVFLVELVRQRISGEFDGDGSTPGLSHSLERVVANRLAALDEEERSIVDVCALLGAPIRPDHLMLITKTRSVRPVLARLESRGFLRTRARDGSIEIFHDRIRDALLDGLDDARIATLNRLICDTLCEVDDASPDLLAWSLHGCGERAKAADAAIRAAEASMHSLAFDRAARFYANALEWGDFPIEREARIRERVAIALTSAGRCSEAAEAFLEARALWEGPDRRTLSIRAIESLLLAGRIDEGLEVARPLLEEVGVAFPESGGGAALSMAPDPVLPASPMTGQAAPEDAGQHVLRADVCWALAKGLAYVRPLEGSHFLMHALHESVRSGDPLRIGRAMAMAGASVLAQTPALAGRAGRYLDAVEQVAADEQDPYLTAMVKVWRAFRHQSTGEWDTIIDWASSGLEILRRDCVGTSWERVVAGGMVVLAVQWQGDLRRVRLDADRWLNECEDVGDLYGQVLFRQNLAFCDLAAGRIDEARSHVDWIRTNWVRAGTVPHFFCRVYQMYADLYEGRTHGVRERMQRLVDGARRGGSERMEMGRVESLLVEARVRLHLAAEDDLDEERMREIVAAFGRGARVDNRHHAQMLHAGFAPLAEALPLLASAAAGYDALGMRLFAESARLRLARLTEDDRARKLSQEALMRLGVGEPDRWVGIFSPGFHRAR